METMIGAYGPWAASIVGDEPGCLSLRRECWDDLDEWRAMARQRVWERMAPPDTGPTPEVATHSVTDRDGLHIEKLSWQLPYGPPTEAYFLKPAGESGPLPGLLALHDHGGNKYFGKRKIALADQPAHPLMVEHQERCYGGRPWANEVARLGYAVLVPDAFAFASRRVRPEDTPAVVRGETCDPVEDDIETIHAYNAWAAQHEHLMAKSLFSAGLTWPGVFVAEDQRALDVLCSRPDVDAGRVGCGGLSGGGLRTVYLAGLDPRIRCAVCVGMMTTWRDYLLHRCRTHTWMVYVPLLPRELDYPEILGLRAPAPTMVLNNEQDPLFTMPEMRRADEMLRQVYDVVGAPDAHRCHFHPGHHKFDLPMQEQAIAWWNQWLTDCSPA